MKKISESERNQIQDKFGEESRTSLILFSLKAKVQPNVIKQRSFRDHFFLAEEYFRTHKYTDAKKHYLLAQNNLVVCDEASYRQWLAITQKLLTIHQDGKNDTQLYACLHSLRRMAANYKDKVNEIIALRRMVNELINKRQYDDASFYLTEMFDLFEASPTQHQEQKNCMMKMAYCALNTRDYQQVLECYNNVLDILTQKISTQSPTFIRHLFDYALCVLLSKQSITEEDWGKIEKYNPEFRTMEESQYSGAIYALELLIANRNRPRLDEYLDSEQFKDIVGLGTNLTEYLLNSIRPLAIDVVFRPRS